MFRSLLVVSVIAGCLLPASAMACGMKMKRPVKEIGLAALFDEIDAKEAQDAKDDKPEVAEVVKEDKVAPAPTKPTPVQPST